MKKKFLFLLFFITISISGFTASYAAEPTKYNNTYIVNYGSTVEFTGTYSSLSSSNSDLAPISDNKIKISGAGRFSVTVNNNSSLDFFSWNTYLKKGKFWTYSSQAKKNKLNVVTSKTYLATTEINSSTFLVNDSLFAKNGSYKGSLQGKYITNYYNKAKNKSKSPYYDFSMTSNDNVFQIDLSRFSTVTPEPEPNNPSISIPSVEPAKPTVDTEPTVDIEPNTDTITQDASVKTNVINGLPKLTSSEITSIINSWGSKKYGNSVIETLKKRVFTNTTISDIVNAQDTYNVSAIFMLAVADYEQQLGTSNNEISNTALNLFNMPATVNDLYLPVNSKLYKAYLSYGDSFKDFAKLIAENSSYYNSGNDTIAKIGNIYSSYSNWAEDVVTRVLEILHYAQYEETPSTSKGKHTYTKSGSVVQSYSNSSIDVSIEKISNYYVSKIWVSDPASQVKKAEAGWGKSLKTVNNMLNSISGAIVGCNGSGFYSSSFKCHDSAIKNWDKTSEGYLVISNNAIRRQVKGKKCNYLLGILPNGSFKYYETNPYTDVFNDNVRDSFTFGPLLIKDGKTYTQPGKPRQSYSGSAKRTVAGQVDENNFIIITASGSAKPSAIATFGVSLDCNLLFNLDGGGSTSLWFRNGSSGKGTQVVASSRAVSDALYFTSLE